MLALRALNRKSFKLYYARIYEPFQNINSALFEVSVKESSYSSQSVDSTERSHTSITRDLWTWERDLFFITETLSPEAVVKEESVNHPPPPPPPRPLLEQPAAVVSRGEGESSTIHIGGLERLEGRQECVRPATVILHTAASPSVQLIGIQSRAGSMRERWGWGGGGRKGGGGVAAVCLQQRSTFTARWELTRGAGKRDRHTVTGKMNCHLAFLSLLAASNWPLWTMWRDTDWVLPPPPTPPGL